MIVSGTQLRDWLAAAKAGDVLAYARATCLKANDVTRRLYALAQSGHVALSRIRREHGMGDENFLYLAKRTGKALDDAPRGSCGQLRHVGGRAPQDRRVSDAGAAARAAAAIRAEISDRMARGAALPSPAALARAWDLPSAYVARLALREVLGKAAMGGAAAERMAA